MNFSRNIDEFNNQRKKIILEKKPDLISNISQEIDDILENLQLVRSRKVENITEIDNLISHMIEVLSTIDIIPDFLIEKNQLCDHLIHFLHPPFSNHISYMIHEIFIHICASSYKCAEIVKNSSYFNLIVEYYYTLDFNSKVKDENTNESEVMQEYAEKEEIFIKIIRSLRFGIQYFTDISDLFFSQPYKERFNYLIYNCVFSDNVVHELICLTDSMLFKRSDLEIVSFISPILLDFFMNQKFTKICCDSFIRCAKVSKSYDYLSIIFIGSNEENGEKPGLINTILSILLSPDQIFDIKARVKSFVLLRHILYFLQSQSNDTDPSQITVQTITLDFLNNIIYLFNIEINQKPKHLEMVINSLLQISLNDPSIPSLIYQSQIFQILLELTNNPNATYLVDISCRLLFASLLRSQDTELQINVFERTFNLLADLFESDEQEFIIEAIDAVMEFLEKMNEIGQFEIISKIVNNEDYAWLRDSLNVCMQSSIERIAHTATYLYMQYFQANDQGEVTNE